MTLKVTEQPILSLPMQGMKIAREIAEDEDESPLPAQGMNQSPKENQRP